MPNKQTPDVRPLAAHKDGDAAAQRTRLRVVIVAVLVCWTFFYNFLIKGQTPTTAFFQIIETISDDFIVGTLFTIVLGLGIVIVFSVTKLYTQIISNIYSFKILEDIFYEELSQGNVREFFRKLINFEEQPLPTSECPTRVPALLFMFGLIYIMSWVYIALFSEALFFISWSAGVDLPITPENLLLMPTLALAIPFSARVMAYLKYPYTQDYADFIPGAVFVLLIVAALGYMFQSEDQKFFLTQVYSDRSLLIPFIKNGAYLAFIPVFFESGYWLYKLGQYDDE